MSKTSKSERKGRGNEKPTFNTGISCSPKPFPDNFDEIKKLINGSCSCFIPEEHIFWSKVANTPEYLRRYFAIKRKEIINYGMG